jgi:multicomponent Na+:H+ antiporter subunit A
MLFALLLAHAVLAAAAPVAARRLGPRVFLLCAAAPLATAVWAGARASFVIDGGAVENQVRWIDDLGLSIDLRMDGFSLLMVALISGVGALIFWYASRYFSPRRDIGRIAAMLTAFSGSMLGVVVADNLLVLYVFWELTSVTSFLLIGTDDHKEPARAAARQAILVTGGGGLAMLAGFILLGQAAGTYSLSGLLAAPPSGSTVGAGIVLVAIGAFTKSAQVPFHAWLPGAMAAPTPISAYLHSATMVKAGVYLIARFAPAFAANEAIWRPLVMGVGVATMLVGGIRALRQHDLKLLLAFGTVSQLGFLVVLFGAGRPGLTFAGCSVLLVHGLFKATLFMVVGIVDHEAHSRDVRVLNGLSRQMPLTFAVGLVAVASMAGLPPLAGFLAKEAALEYLLDGAGVLAVIGIVAGSVLTFAYAARFLWGGFAAKRDVDPTPVSPPPLEFVAPAVLLTLTTLAFGLVPAAGSSFAGAAARSLDPSVAKPRLYLWHGFTTALTLSLVTFAVGAALFLWRVHVERFQARLGGWQGSQRVYDASVSGLVRLSERVTAIVQNGSLPVYVGVICLTVLALPGWELLTRTSLPSGIELADSPMQLVVAVAVLVAAVATAVARRRFVAVLLLGAVGFGVAVLFVIQGAPDLALTQLLIETLALVIFVLVLRNLPERFESVPWRLATNLRLVIALGMGVFVTVFGLVAAGSRRGVSVSQEQLERALPEGGGRNVVNVILTDFRALDTLGEITVLLVAALGIASLVAAGRARTAGTEDTDES